jgi:hypothetical protein
LNLVVISNNYYSAVLKFLKNHQQPENQPIFIQLVIAPLRFLISSWFINLDFPAYFFQQIKALKNSSAYGRVKDKMLNPGTNSRNAVNLPS